ncbi:hypothetical protein GWK47_000568 [Chionoecetes opilio]|uniref:Uncharacterized protein n=1 Tax=Chionoecetes opilio TaxID=41210 RepID=A0A8J5CVQ3_CHIOP|nr:hypothetical protein GWK47_000568 [Chionoecetes opilio]
MSIVWAIVCHHPPLKGRSSWYPCLATRSRRSKGHKVRRPSTRKFEDKLEVSASTPPLQKRAPCWLLHNPRTELGRSFFNLGWPTPYGLILAPPSRAPFGDATSGPKFNYSNGSKKSGPPS